MWDRCWLMGSVGEWVDIDCTGDWLMWSTQTIWSGSTNEGPGDWTQFKVFNTRLDDHRVYKSVSVLHASINRDPITSSQHWFKQTHCDTPQSPKSIINAHPTKPLPPFCRSQLNLIDGINNDVVVSTVINGGQLCLHQFLHPTYPSLNLLQTYMSQSYSQFESPMLPNYAVNSVCVGCIDGHWYRLQIIENYPDDGSCLAKYLDYGGYCRLASTELRQIRTDFMTIPFQAIECMLADIKPKGKLNRSRGESSEGPPRRFPDLLAILNRNFKFNFNSIQFSNAGGEWSAEAAQLVIELSQCKSLQAQVAGYSDAGLPEIYLYSYLGPNVSISPSLSFCNHSFIFERSLTTTSGQSTN